MFVYQICRIDLAEKNSVELRRLDDIAMETCLMSSRGSLAEASPITRALLLLHATYRHGLKSGNPALLTEVGAARAGINFLTNPTYPGLDESVAVHVLRDLEDST